MSDVLTPTEEKVYQYLIAFLAANSYQPSIREIGREFSIKSTKTVSDVLGSLARKGYIQRNQARSRGLRIIGAHSGASAAVPSVTLAIPFFRTVAEHGVALRPEHRAGAIHLDRRLVPHDSACFVRVSDDGMAARSIHTDDTVLVMPEQTPVSGDLVAVRIGNDVVVRAVGTVGAEHVIGVVKGAFCIQLDHDETVDADAEFAAA
jgi:repressor LexA